MANLPNYPTPAQLRAQAAAAANASLPSVNSISQPYNQSLTDVSGFAKALLAQLKGGVPAAGNAYSESLGDQATVNQAAQARLGALSGPYAAGSQAAVGGLGDSATSRLLEDRASATNYASQLPSVSAARASLAQAALLKQKQQALQQRQQDYRAAYAPALQNAQDNALQRSVAIANIGNQKAQLALSNRQLNAQISQNAAQLAEQQREFGISNSYRYAALAAQTGSSSSGKGGPSAALARSLGITPSELQGQVQDAAKLLGGESPKTENIATYKNVPDPNHPGKTKQVITGYRQVAVKGSGAAGAVDAGVPFPTAVQVLISKGGLTPQVALYSASQIYKNARGQNAYAWLTYAQWMAKHGSKKYKKIMQQIYVQTNRPGTPPRGLQP